MPNANEKLITALVGLVPVIRTAFRDGDLSHQFDAVMSNGKVRHAGSKMAGQVERYVQHSLSGNKFARQMSKKFAPRQSNLPVIALTAVGIGIILTLLASGKAKPKTAEVVRENGADIEKKDRTIVENYNGSASQKPNTVQPQF